MPISFNEKNRIFKLDAGNSTYAFMIESNGYLAHLHYGGRIGSDALNYLYRPLDRAFSPAAPGTTAPESRDVILQEYGTNGIGDFHAPSAIVRQENGHRVTDFKYRSHRIFKGKPGIEGLPATFGSESDLETLELSLYDEAGDIEFLLSYTVFERHNAIARSARAVNRSLETVRLEKLSSASLDFPEGNFDLIHLPGAWARERAVERGPISHARTVIESVRGLSSHQQNPFFALAAPHATETAGEVYGVALLYSGNFAAEIERDQFDRLRAQIGINERTFEWKLAPNESFSAPEALLVYSASGIGAMSRTFHDVFRNHLIRSYWKDLKRPILVNNWEATYFNFNTEKLLAIAKDAAELGIEMLVLDDGWFGHRDDDHSSLGDWFVYESKLKGGLGKLVSEVNKLGLKFGLWFEPEMVSRDSELFKAHPDWCLHVPGRGASEGRNQLVLDMSRPEVVDYLFKTISGVLDSANIEYIKWDANRHLTEVGSATASADRQKEISHRYVLGMYRLHELLIERYPKLLIEGCSGGGGRFDAGMLYYVPQIWTSDDTDAIERLRIQSGTSMEDSGQPPVGAFEIAQRDVKIDDAEHNGKRNYEKSGVKQRDPEFERAEKRPPIPGHSRTLSQSGSTSYQTVCPPSRGGGRFRLRRCCSGCRSCIPRHAPGWWSSRPPGPGCASGIRAAGIRAAEGRSLRRSASLSAAAGPAPDPGRQAWSAPPSARPGAAGPGCGPGVR